MLFEMNREGREFVFARDKSKYEKVWMGGVRVRVCLCHGFALLARANRFVGVLPLGGCEVVPFQPSLGFPLTNLLDRVHGRHVPVCVDTDEEKEEEEERKKRQDKCLE